MSESTNIALVGLFDYRSIKEGVVVTPAGQDMHLLSNSFARIVVEHDVLAGGFWVLIS